MLTRENYHAALVLAKELDDKKVFLKAMPGCPLGQLVDASVSVDTVKTTELPVMLVRNGATFGGLNLTADDRACSVAYATDNYDGTSQHSATLTALADQLAPLVSSHLSAARNVVKPMVVELAEKFHKYLQDQKPYDPISMIDLQQREIPALALDETFLSGGLAKFEGAAVKHHYFGGKITWLNLEDADLIGQLANLANDRLNGLLKTWLQGKEPNYLKKVFDANYGQGQYMEGYALGTTQNVYDRLDLGMACWILGERILSDATQSRDAEVVKIRESLRAFVDYAGQEAFGALRMALKIKEESKIVVEVNMPAKRIIVNKTNYQEWLKAGGSPEVILGMIASGNVVYTAAGLTADVTEKLKQSWSTYSALSKSSLHAQMLQNFASYAESEALMGLTNMTDLEKEFGKDNPNFRLNVETRIRAEMKRLSHRVIEDPEHLALCLIAKARFYYTSAYDILNEMVEVFKHNPEVDPREAAFLATVNYIGKFCVAQVQVVK